MEIVGLNLKRNRPMIERLLKQAGIGYEDDIAYMAAVFDGDEPVAVGGLAGRVIKCLAVVQQRRGEGIINTLVTHLYTMIREQGHLSAFIFTAPHNRFMFEELGFYTVAEAQDSILMESLKDGVERWARGLGSPGGDCAAIIMHANPFTNGHRYLIEQAAHGGLPLHVFVLEHSAPPIPFADRLKLVREGVSDIPGVFVHPAGPYIISKATFPSYYLKQASDMARAHAGLDAAVFAQRIAPALSIKRRFVGTEPLDAMTSLYNETLMAVLPAAGVEVVVVKRLADGESAISASRVRRLWQANRIEAVKHMVPEATFRYLVGKPYES